MTGLAKMKSGALSAGNNVTGLAEKRAGGARNKGESKDEGKGKSQNSAVQEWFLRSKYLLADTL